jgi:tetratricopeptide (TPR) repeat protein
VITFDQLAASIANNRENQVLEDPAFLSCRVYQAWFCSNLGMVEESEAISKTCLEPLHGLDMVRERAICLHNLGLNAEFQGDYERSRKLLEEAIELGKMDPFVALPSFYLWLGYVYFLVGEYGKGMHSFRTSYESFMERGNTWGASFALSKMGLAADGLGKHAAAMTYFQEANKIFIKTGDLTGQGYSLSRMSIGAYFLDDYKEGIHYGEQALEQFKNIGHRWGMCVSLCHLGFCNLGMGQKLEAQTLFYEALQKAVDGQFAPLSLYALAGIASTLVLTNKSPKGVAFFQFVQSHPKTPALYVEVAKRWFHGQEETLSKGKRRMATDPTLDEMVQDALKEREPMIKNPAP